LHKPEASSIQLQLYLVVVDHPDGIISISIQPLGRFWQEPEPSQATVMALARCILGKFLGVVCHCFALPLGVPTFAARCLHVLMAYSKENSRSDEVRHGVTCLHGFMTSITICVLSCGSFYSKKVVIKFRHVLTVSCGWINYVMSGEGVIITPEI
jgi:hypothetical protein